MKTVGAGLLDEKGLPVCQCRRVAQPHEHGTRGMYGCHGCRCVPCVSANSDYHRAYVARYRTPIRPMTDAGPVRKRIATLRAAGLTIAEIAALCGINQHVISHAVNGRKGNPPRKVLASTLKALNAISYKDITDVQKPRGRKVDAEIPCRQARSLYSLGWAVPEIAEQLGVAVNTVNRIINGNSNTTEEIRAGMAELYAKLHGTEPPQNTPVTKRRAALARKRARENGWTTDTAEDHIYQVATRFP